MIEAGRRINVEISPSGYQAFVYVDPWAIPGALGRPITLQEIQAALKSQNVTFGIDEDVINEIIDEQKWKQKIQVAQGHVPVKGRDCEIEYYFNTDSKPRPKELNNGCVDYRDIGLINLVEKDDVIARRIPAEPGKAGITVKGDRITADNGEDKFISAGTNTYFANDGDTELRASIIGSVAIEFGLVKVEDILILNKGVNFATGNIDYPGDVIITGDVESGFSVKAEGKVEISGVVSDAIIEAEGDVLVKCGFIGSGKGKITSRHDVFVKFIDNQQVEAGCCVHIGDNCVQATIMAVERIEVNSGSGTVIGGHLRARDCILAKNLGNQQHTKTVVEITGDVELYAEKLHRKEDEIQDIKTKITEITSFVSRLKRENMESRESEPKTVEKIQKYQDLAQDLNQKVEKLEAEMKAWAEDGGCKGDIQVSSKVYPGTVIIMGGASICVENETGKALFKRSGEEIIDMNAPKAIEQQPEPV